MISMSQTYSIPQLRKSGESISEIARKVGVSRNTVYAKLAAPRPVAADAGEGAQGEDARRVQAGHRGVSRRGRAGLAQAKAHRAPHLAAPSRRARRRLQRIHRQALRPRPQGPEEERRRILPRPRLEPRRGAGRLRGGRLRHRRRKAQDELLHALLPVLQHGVRPGLPLRERRVRVPGAQADLRIRGRRPHQDRLRQRHRRRPQGLRRGQDHRDLRRVRRPLRVRLLVLQPPIPGTRRATSRARSGS